MLFSCPALGRLYTYRYTVTTGMTPALRWAAMRAILMFHNCEGQSHKTVSTDFNFWRERRTEADSNRGPSAYQPNALPLRQTGSNRLLFISPGLTRDFKRGRETRRKCCRSTTVCFREKRVPVTVTLFSINFLATKYYFVEVCDTN